MSPQDLFFDLQESLDTLQAAIDGKCTDNERGDLLAARKDIQDAVKRLLSFAKSKAAK